MRIFTTNWERGRETPARLHCPLPNRVGVFAPVLPRLRTFRGDPGGIMILYCLLGTSSLNLEWKHNLIPRCTSLHSQRLLFLRGQHHKNQLQGSDTADTT